ncbi:hypothetical protein FOZ63_010725 [Perkinsus olseni]|uniref:Uncharacterized protein n=1 Tax=Perkinsus olseni TaxID=32597 RepID=A0A7J6RPH4_PEROL|nr:hypothetical protein FOZ60_017122 [Perkinsus olseni]KAF4709647.1 hypothetical protein FOZ62_029715 [Perkinsus olseni]KAF4722365.1 hypothetical protein FOZ63_010725 [Perkinsus olseni]
MLFLPIASVATIIRATTVGHESPLEFGTYEMEGHNAVDTSLAGMMMEVKQSKHKTYADVMLVRTVQGVEGKKMITPGRYLKADVQATKLEDLVDIEIKVSKGRPGKQTANITFYHREKVEYSLYELPLKTYFRHADRFVNVDEYRHRRYGMRDRQRTNEMLTDQFAEVAVAFGKDLPGVSKYSSMICVEGKDSISFE